MAQAGCCRTSVESTNEDVQWLLSMCVYDDVLKNKFHLSVLVTQTLSTDTCMFMPLEEGPLNRHQLLFRHDATEVLNALAFLIVC